MNPALTAAVAAALTPTALASLLPLLTLSLTILVLLLVIPFRRCACLSYRIAFTGTAASLVAVLPVAALLPQQVTPLLLVDGAALLWFALLLAGALVLLPLARDYWASRSGQPVDEHHLLLLLALLGALVLVASDHFASLFIGLELLSLPLVVLVAYPFTRDYAAPLEAGIKYLVLSGAASATLLFGIALIYAVTGELGFAVVAGRDSPLLQAGLMLLLAGVAFKLSLVPFHLWTPDVYQGAPLPATALLATLAKAALVAALLRYLQASHAWELSALNTVLALLAAASMLAGNLLALLQQDLKRLLAYSSIGHFGYLLLGLLALAPAGNGLGIESVHYYLVAYSAATLAAFAVLIRLADGEERVQLDDYHGLFWQRPGLAALFTLALLSLAGIPLTIGFVGKFYLIAAALTQGLWWLLLVLVVASAIGLFYYLRIILVMTRGEAPGIAHPPWRRDPVLALLALVTLGLGLYPTPLIDLIRHLNHLLG